MKHLLLFCTAGLLLTQACKKDDDSSGGTSGGSSTSNRIVATPAPPGFVFPKTFNETSRIEEFKIWVKGVDVSNKVSADKVFEPQDWESFQITLVNTTTMKGTILTSGETFTYQYYYYKNGLYLIDKTDTFPFPIAFGNYNQLEFYNYEIKLTAASSSYSRDVFEKSTKASLEKEAADMGMSPIDTMAYINSSLFMK